MGGWDPGSQGDGGQILNDVWRLDLSSWTWTEASIQVNLTSSHFPSVLWGKSLPHHAWQTVVVVQRHILPSLETLACDVMGSCLAHDAWLLMANKKYRGQSG